MFSNLEVATGIDILVEIFWLVMSILICCISHNVVSAWYMQ